MKAILTKYIGPSNTKGGRIIASDCDGNKVTISYPDEISGYEECHRVAAEKLCAKMQWKGEMVAGAIKGGYAFVFTGK